MSVSDFSLLLDAVSERQNRIQAYMFAEENGVKFSHQHLTDAVYSYLKAGGKSLRPAVLMFACGLVGGDEERALPAASTVELYHTFTLVHDDIIDRDELRRGVPTVHADFARRAKKELGYDDATAAHYGLAVAILAGDMQMGWAASLLTKIHTQYGVDATLALNLINDLFMRVQALLIEGETLDVALSEAPLDHVKESVVIDMLWKKTGVLYEFAGRAGAAIGLNQADLNDPQIRAISDFTGKCGTAFQMQDDILGVIGNESQLGKPVGSDIREGKRTLIVLGSMNNMTNPERKLLLRVLGNELATDSEVQEVIGLLRERGGINHAQSLSRQYLEEAITSIKDVPASEYKTLLESWAHYMIERQF
ncbi:MAG: polyprenyl synthetase family protein [Aggregatilineales bacterium]